MRDKAIQAALMANPDAVEYQRLLLEAEGIGFDHRQLIDLDRYRWRAPA